IGLCVYRGRSLLTGRPIAVVLTYRSKNPKTGPVVQSWILSARRNPVEAARRGLDRDVCGDCPLRRKVCYVLLGHAPLAVYRALGRGQYPDATPRAAAVTLAGRVLRLGSYGDPAAVPFRVWSTLAAGARAHVGYTHQWRTCDQRLRRLCMASVETPS